jgi:hypothetical protein
LPPISFVEPAAVKFTASEVSIDEGGCREVAVLNFSVAEWTRYSLTGQAYTRDDIGYFAL